MTDKMMASLPDLPVSFVEDFFIGNKVLINRRKEDDFSGLSEEISEEKPKEKKEGEQK